MLKLLCFGGLLICFFISMGGLALAFITRDVKQHRKELMKLKAQGKLNYLQQDILKIKTVEFMKWQVPLSTAYPIAFAIASVAGGICYLLVLAASMME